MEKWVEADCKFGGWNCSECGYFNWPGKLTPFCPYCGAKMKNPSNDLLESVQLYKDVRKIKKSGKSTDAFETSP